ncbi:MAG: hypothetical protein K2X32_15135, partial [Phycisphaerales bacterium]|nr:hypothetical protein [Phycisphaerales bacterium]
AGVTRIGINLLGAGGGGGSRTAGNLAIGCSGTPGTTAGQGGGSGAAIRALVDVTPGETLTIVVGGGGAGAPGIGLPGLAGGDTILRRGATNLLIAGGGRGGGAGIPALNVQGNNPCSISAPSQGGTGQRGVASAPGGAGVTPILLRDGFSGGAPLLGTCSGQSLVNQGCGGFGAAAQTLPAPLLALSGSGGNGASVAQPTSALSGAPGGASIWWD